MGHTNPHIKHIHTRQTQIYKGLTDCQPHTLWYYRADSRPAPSQWETSLQSNTVSNWLGANLWLASPVIHGVPIAKAWWRHQMAKFSVLLALCAGNSPVTDLNSPHKGQWRGVLMFSLICAWTNGWVINPCVGDFRRHCVHYDVTVMIPRRVNFGFTLQGPMSHLGGQAIGCVLWIFEGQSPGGLRRTLYIIGTWCYIQTQNIP